MKNLITLVILLLNLKTIAQNSTNICSIGFISEDSIEIVFTKPNDSLVLNQVDNYQLYIKTNPQSGWSYKKTIGKNDLSVFYDTISNINDSNYYQIKVFDNSGNIIDTSQIASYIHFNTLIDTLTSKVEFFVCPPLGIQCSQFFIVKDSSGTKDTIITLAPNPFCISFIQFYGNGVNANFYIVGELINSCYPNFKINSGTSISSNIKNVFIPYISTEIKENFNGNNPMIYPNPASTHFFIVGIENDYQIVINDIQGNIIQKNMYFGNSFVSAESISNGIYFIKIISKQNTFIYKIEIIKN